MNVTNIVYLTRDRLLELENELNNLKTKGRDEIARKISEARSHGDLSENAEYDAAKHEQGLLEFKISKLEQTLSRTQVIDITSVATEKLSILLNVKLKNLKSGNINNYILVSPEEADFDNGKLSVGSPLGKELLGKKVGDIVDVKAPAGVIKFQVLEIYK